MIIFPQISFFPISNINHESGNWWKMVGGLHVHTEVRGQLSSLHLFMGSGGQTQAHRLAQLLTPLYGFWRWGESNSGLQACTASTFTCLAVSPASTVLSSHVGGRGDLLSYSLFPLSLAPSVYTYNLVPFPKLALWIFHATYQILPFAIAKLESCFQMSAVLKMTILLTVQAGAYLRVKVGIIIDYARIINRVKRACQSSMWAL